MAHWYEHMGAMIGGGIAFHTALAVFGIQRFIQYSFGGLRRGASKDPPWSCRIGGDLGMAETLQAQVR